MWQRSALDLTARIKWFGDYVLDFRTAPQPLEKEFNP
jgi:hypothetical protein